MSDSRPTLRDTVESQRAGWPVHWAALLALFVLCQSIALAVSINRGAPPDEMAHISYVNDVAEGGTLLPDYSEGRIIQSDRKNYLMHPPLYYTALGLFSRMTGTDPVEGHVALRILSACFVGAGIFFWLLAFRNLNLGLGTAAVGTLATCAVPMFTFVAGSVNNDTLAYLGAGLAFFGLSRFRLRPDSRDVAGISCFVVGIILSFLTKATVSAFLVFFLAALALLRWKDLPALLRNRYYLWAAAAIAVTCGGYYLYTLYAFGQLFPRASVLYAKNPPANPDSLREFGLFYVEVMWRRFPAILKTKPLAEAMRPAFFTMAMLPLAGWLLARPSARSRGAQPFHIAAGDAFVIALLVTFVLHILVTYKGYLHHGLYAGWQPRYFFFALPATWFLMTLVRPGPVIRFTVLAAFAASACISFWSSAPFVVANYKAKLTPKCVPATGMSGYIDEFRLANGRLQARGWAFDAATRTAPQRVWVMLDGARLGSATVDDPRPDVAKALCSSAARNTGFRLDVLDVPPAMEPCRVVIKAESTDGSLRTLANPACRK